MRTIELQQKGYSNNPSYFILIDGKPLTVGWSNPGDLSRFVAYGLDVKAEIISIMQQELQLTASDYNLSEEEITTIINLCRETLK